MRRQERASERKRRRERHGVGGLRVFTHAHRHVPSARSRVSAQRSRCRLYLAPRAASGLGSRRRVGAVSADRPATRFPHVSKVRKSFQCFVVVVFFFVVFLFFFFTLETSNRAVGSLSEDNVLTMPNPQGGGKGSGGRQSKVSSASSRRPSQWKGA